MQSRALFIAVVATLASTAVACVDTAPLEDEPLASAEGRIEAGSTARDYPEIALLDGEKGGVPAPGCTGALIAPRAVLTSGRCAGRFDAWRVTLPYADGQTANGVGFAVYDLDRAAPPQAGGDRGIDRNVDVWHGGDHGVDRNVDGRHGSAAVDRTVDVWHGAQHDVGLIFLDRPVMLCAYPELADAPLADGERVVTMGRLLDGRLFDGRLVPTGAYLSEPVAVRDASPAGFPYAYAIPGADASGGPVFLPGTHTLVGVGAGSTDRAALVARVDLVSRWIRDQVEAADGAGEPGPETPR